MNRPTPRKAASVLAAPLLLAAVSLGGLVLGLTGDGWRDAACVGALALPLFIFLYHLGRRSSASRRPNAKD